MLHSPTPDVNGQLLYTNRALPINDGSTMTTPTIELSSRLKIAMKPSKGGWLNDDQIS